MSNSRLSPAGGPRPILIRRATGSRRRNAVVRRGNRRARGRDTADLYARAGDLLIREHPGVTRDPGAAMILSVATLGLVLHRDFDRARGYCTTWPAAWSRCSAPRMARRGTGGDHGAGRRDRTGHPSRRRCDGSRRTGGRLMSLARRIGTRRDFPLVDEVLHSIDDVGAAAVPNWTEGRWRRVDVSTRRHSRVHAPTAR